MSGNKIEELDNVKDPYNESDTIHDEEELENIILK